MLKEIASLEAAGYSVEFEDFMQTSALSTQNRPAVPLARIENTRAGGPCHLSVSLPATLPGLAANMSNLGELCARQNDQTVPVQVTPLGQDLDGEPRWYFCETVVDQGSWSFEQGDAQPFDHPAQLSESPDALTVTNGLVSATINLQAEAKAGTANVVGAACVGACGSEAKIDISPAIQSQNTAYQGRLSANAANMRARQIAVGPARAAIELEADHLDELGQPLLRYRLRLEVFADMPTVSVQYWFFNLEKDRQNVPIDSIELNMPISGATGQRSVLQSQYGLSCVPRLVQCDQALDARVGHDGAMTLRLADPSPLGDENDYPDYLMPPLDMIAPWMSAQVQGGWWAMTVDDLPQLKPKGIRLDDAGFAVDVWPKWADTLDLPQGRSRSVTTRLTFKTGEEPMAASEVTQRFAATRSDSPAMLQPSGYSDAKVFGQDAILPNRSDSATRFNDFLRKVACPPTVCDFFDLGDTIDPGYSRTYLTTGRRLNPIVPADQVEPIQFMTNRYTAEYSNLSQYENVWANNEYDVIWCIGGEMMRSQRPELFQSLRWFSRHAIEVDFVHYSDDKIKNRSTPPHCARHTTAGTYPSHLWTEGVLQYYALSGDEDALAFAQAIGDKIVEIFEDPLHRAKLWKPTRELGWALLALAALCEFDPQPRYMKLANEMAEELIQMPLGEEEINNMVRYSFGYASIVLGVDRWHGIVKEERYAKWMAELAERCATRILDDSGVESAMGLCILHSGFKHGASASVLKAGMRTVERLIDSKVWHDPPPYTKPFALLWRPLSRFFADAAEHGLLKPLDYRY